MNRATLVLGLCTAFCVLTGSAFAQTPAQKSAPAPQEKGKKQNKKKAKESLDEIGRKSLKTVGAALNLLELALPIYHDHRAEAIHSLRRARLEIMGAGKQTQEWGAKNKKQQIPDAATPDRYSKDRVVLSQRSMNEAIQRMETLISQLNGNPAKYAKAIESATKSLKEAKIAVGLYPGL